MTKPTPHIRVASPAQREAIAAQGRRWNLASIIVGLICPLFLLPFIGLFAGIGCVRKARAFGHRAPVGVVLAWINAFLTVVYILVAIRVVAEGA